MLCLEPAFLACQGEPMRMPLLGLRTNAHGRHAVQAAIEDFVAPGSEVVFVSRIAYPDLPSNTHKCRQGHAARSMESRCFKGAVVGAVDLEFLAWGALFQHYRAANCTCLGRRPLDGRFVAATALGSAGVCGSEARNRQRKAWVSPRAEKCRKAEECGLALFVNAASHSWRGAPSTTRSAGKLEWAAATPLS
jgi:hypothetical protein